MTMRLAITQVARVTAISYTHGAVRSIDGLRIFSRSSALRFFYGLRCIHLFFGLSGFCLFSWSIVCCSRCCRRHCILFSLRHCCRVNSRFLRSLRRLVSSKRLCRFLIARKREVGSATTENKHCSCNGYILASRS